MKDNVWEKIFSTQAWGKYPAEPLIRFVARNFYDKHRPSVKILELGCGPGANCWYLAREGFSFIGIDGSNSAVQQAKERLNVEVPGWDNRGEILLGDITATDIGHEEFDAIIDNECVYCLPFVKSQQVYANAYRALKPKGKIFVRTFSTETWGYGTGQKIEDCMYECSVGPLANKGGSRFTEKQHIQSLLRDFDAISINETTYTLDEHKIVAEWLIEATK